MAHSPISNEFINDTSPLVTVHPESRVQLTELSRTARAPETELVASATSAEEIEVNSVSPEPWVRGGHSFCAAEHDIGREDGLAISGDDSIIPEGAISAAAADSSGAVAPALPTDEPTTWSTGLEWLDPGTLNEHRLWHELLGFEPTQAEEDFADSVRHCKVLHPIIVTGPGCASGVDVILDGHRRRRAAMDAGISRVPVVRCTDLTAEAEEAIILRAALSSAHTRKLKPSQLAALEDRLFKLYARTPGFRSDIATSVGNNGGSTLHGDTLDLVAKASGQSRNGLANRRKVFASPVSPPLLREAVDSGTLSLSAAAGLVRAAERGELVPAASDSVEKSPEFRASEGARAMLEAQVRDQLRKPKRPRAGAVERRAGRAETLALPTDGSPVALRLGPTTIWLRIAVIGETEVGIEVLRDSRRPSSRGEKGSSSEDACNEVLEGHDSSRGTPNGDDSCAEATGGAAATEPSPMNEDSLEALPPILDALADPALGCPGTAEDDTADPQAPPSIDPDDTGEVDSAASEVSCNASSSGVPASFDPTRNAEPQSLKRGGKKMPPRRQLIWDVLVGKHCTVAQVVDAMEKAGTMPNTKDPMRYIGQELSYGVGDDDFVRVGRGLYTAQL